MSPSFTAAAKACADGKCGDCSTCKAAGKWRILTRFWGHIQCINIFNGVFRFKNSNRINTFNWLILFTALASSNASGSGGSATAVAKTYAEAGS